MADAQTDTRTMERNGVYATGGMSEHPHDQALRDQSPTEEGSSDSDQAERTARNKLKKASIAALSEKTQTKQPVHGGHPFSESITAQSEFTEAEPRPRGRLAKKRSFENLQTDDSPTTTTFENGSADHPPAKNGHHKRMRSRDISSGEYISSGSKFDNGTTDPLEEESDEEAQLTPGGPGVLIDAPSRETTTPPPTGTFNDSSDPADITSPKKKRSRDQFDTEDTSKAAASKEKAPEPQAERLAPTVSRTATGEPEKKRHRDEALAKSQGAIEPSAMISAAIIPATSGFRNASAASPFGNFRSPPEDSETPEHLAAKATSTSAFASSGLSAFASSEKSPFGAFGSSNASSAGGFGSGDAYSGFGSASGATSKGGFGNTGATSPFAGNRTTGFGSFGGFGSTSTSGFGSGGFGAGIKPLGGGLSSFASGNGTVRFGGSSGMKHKAFGAPADEDEDGSEGGDFDENDIDDRPKDKRFVEQDVDTGEDGEDTIFSCRAKLFRFEGKEWKEAGVGTVKLNEKWVSSPSAAEPDGEDVDEEVRYGEGRTGLERKARLIMRTDGVHRVVLNTPVFKGMKVGTVDGGEPTGKTMQLTGMEGGKGVLYTLKIGKDEVVKELWRRIVDVQQGL